MNRYRISLALIILLLGGAFFVFDLQRFFTLEAVKGQQEAIAAFRAARFLFRKAVQARFGERLPAVDAGIARDGAIYLFTLRLVPAFPFFIINLVMGLTALPARTFYWVSQVGMLAGTMVYVNAGTQLAQIVECPVAERA